MIDLYKDMDVDIDIIWQYVVRTRVTLLVAKSVPAIVVTILVICGCNAKPNIRKHQ